MDKALPIVKVVTSVFNGEKYIKEQVDSVLKQTYPNIELYIRDNCSTDHTLEVLREYEHHPQIHIIPGEKNVGCTLGFFTLLRLCGDADYYAYCDCDDVWPENKVELAVEVLEQDRLTYLHADGQGPILYCSAHDVCDENLKYICKSPKIKRLSFQNCLVDCGIFSSTFVFNARTRELLTQNMPEHAMAHDHWTYMVCQGLGKIIYDPRPLMRYRRHGKNITPSTESKMKFMIWRIKYFLIDGKLRNIKEEIQEYSDIFSNQLCEGNRKTLELFTRQNVSTTLKKVFYPKMFRQNLPDEIMLRGLFLLGII